MAQAVQLAALHGAGGVNRALGQAFRRCICGGQAAHPGTGEVASAAGAGGIIAGSAAGQLTLHDLTEVRRPAAGRLTIFKSQSGPAVAINRLRHTAGIALSLPLMPRSEEEVLRWPVSAAASPTGNTDSADRIPELRRTLLRCVINPRMEQRTLPPLCVAIGILVLID